ncbi:MAG TPA: D-aminoacylase [Gemmatimonadaceae bacterium]|jgi:N-acyl-D-amino-acid deacylase|nr:D-aminoacylase [Gemmatimonadaceae bacterium]
MNRSVRSASLFAIALAAACSKPAAAPAPETSATKGVLIVNARVIDGTGAPSRVTSVRVSGDRIADIGDLHQRQGETVVVGTGLVLAPGFIDDHSHADGAFFEHRDALADVSQGITTVIVGQDGGSEYPLADFFAHVQREPSALNVASYVGHGTVRDLVLGKDYKRVATPAEVLKMQVLVDQEMRSGALGLSSGLEYDPGIYSDPSEVLALAKTAGAQGGRYISHMRSEDFAFWKALDELITIGRENHMPVQVSHIKLAMKASWGLGDSLIRVLDRARESGVQVTADIYPYTYWHSGMSVLFPHRDFDNRKSAAFALDQVAPSEGLILANYGPKPEYSGKTLHDVAALMSVDDTTALMQLLHESEAAEARGDTAHSDNAIIAKSMDEADVAKLMAWQWAAFCTDGELDGKHPRGYGTFTRILGRYVREQHIMPLEEAIRKATSLAAANVGIKDRGQISVGSYADLVLFDPTTVIDRATPTEPHLVSTGIRSVWVNGAVVYDGEHTTDARPGRVIKRVMTVPAKATTSK